MELKTAIERLKKYYEVAEKSPYVKYKTAWALYQVWKEADREERNG